MNGPSARRPFGGRGLGLGPLLPLIGLLVVVGCAKQPVDCDPTQFTSVWTAGACQASGASQARVDALRADVNAKVEAYRLTEAETLRLEAEAARLANDNALWQARVEEIDRDLKRLQRQLGGLTAVNAEEQARLNALKQELADAQGALDQGADDAATRAEIERLTLEIERRKQAIEVYSREIDVVE